MLGNILDGIHIKDFLGDPNRKVGGITSNSGEVSTKTLFFALRGFNRDGHDFIPDAIRKGAAGIVLDRSELMAKIAPLAEEFGAAVALVSDARHALGLAASNLYGNPTGSLSLIGVVGTNGKTSTSYILEAILSTWLRVGVIGTISYRSPGVERKASLTTPAPVALQSILADMAHDSVQVVILETSSHGIAQGRIDGCSFNIGIFTNITPEHLDFHGTFENYLAAKLKFFEEHLAPRSSDTKPVAVMNLDSERSATFIGASRVRTVTFSSSNEGADFYAHDIKLGQTATRFVVRTPSAEYEVTTSLIGAHSVQNCLGAIAASTAMGATREQIINGIASLSLVPGRFERVDCGQPFQVIVDFAHTPDAITKAIDAARSVCDGRIISIIGAGGDRDKSKRAPMGQTTAEASDICIITSDNPRTEAPMSIIEEIEKGARRSSCASLYIEPDRQTAIGLGIEKASSGDIVMILGKGHETYQIIGEHRMPFDDRDVAREFLREMGYCLRGESN
ncbi:UDP-N-acetylmuramoyl-L-alanyl-D-glutamate--2,6-diaminopimelate ligase [bacterium]|nr:UDP-N-acetylmuramoyl-L-alanyl-D-glutamate--2,6-diaminopimelate ligase [bacterium]